MSARSVKSPSPPGGQLLKGATREGVGSQSSSPFSPRHHQGKGGNRSLFLSPLQAQTITPGSFHGCAGRLFGSDDYASIYAEKGSQGMPTLRGFEVIGALAEISALSLNWLCGLGQYASIVDFCFLVHKMGLIVTTHTGLVRIKGGKYAVVTSSSPTQCDTSVTVVYSISLKGTSNLSITQAKTLGVLLAPLSQPSSNLPVPLPALPPTFTSRPDTPGPSTAIV